MVSATALCHGAATIVNAIATGRGAAFGIGLGSRVTVELKDSPSITVLGSESSVHGAEEDPKLVETCVKNALKLFPKYGYGATIKVESEIPVARGLKSSSVVANAAVLATFGALAKKHGGIKTLRIDKETHRQQLVINGAELKDDVVLDISIRSAKEAGVTITGALDDAAASYFGGFVVTDNLKNKIARRGMMEKLNAVIFVPEERAYTKDVDVVALKAFSRELDAVWSMALSGDLYTAMTLNGLICSAALETEDRRRGTAVASAAMKAGAVAAGLSGKGPAVVAIVKGDTRGIKDAWSSLGGRVIETTVSNEKGRIVS